MARHCLGLWLGLGLGLGLGLELGLGLVLGLGGLSCGSGPGLGGGVLCHIAWVLLRFTSAQPCIGPPLV